MAKSGSEIAFPTLEQIIGINRRMIGLFGGSFTPPGNFHNRASLEYILTAIRFPIVEHHLFPSMKEKAAALSFEIISSHVFLDGNKRTAIHAAWEFLQANAVSLFLDESIEGVAVAIAAGSASRDELLSWLHDHQN